VTTPAASGVRAAILDGDRSLRLTLVSGRSLVVDGDLGEPMLWFHDDAIWVNESSPTAQADRLVGHARRGWRLVAGGRAFTWYEHRLSPAPYESGSYGAVARWSMPVSLDGRRFPIGGAFRRVPRPRWWLWLGGTLAAAGVATWLLRGRHSGPRPTLAAAIVAAAAAICCQTAFVLRESPSGRLPWVAIGIGLAIAHAGAALLAFSRGVARVYLAGGIGAGIAALTLPWLGVFFHGAVVAALRATALRFGCTLALGGVLVALAASLAVREEDA
jgi:hypothetical protein